MIPGMVDSIKEGMREDIEECSDKPEWQDTSWSTPSRRRIN